MKNIGVIFGGQSVEHEISIITGIQIIENLDKNKYKVFPIYIDKNGDWFYGDILKNIDIYKKWDKEKKKAKQFYPALNKKDNKNILNKLSVIINGMHGNYGEDGKIQGLFDFMDIPYTSCGVTGSACGMDKIVMKKILSGMGLPILPFLWFNRNEWKVDKNEWINKIHYTLDYPIFIKPANLGSSIGISMANNEKELIDGVEIAIQYDKRILVEKGIPNAVEVNCSVMSKNNEILLSELEEPIKWDNFLTFKDKYLQNSNKSKAGLAQMGRKIPAEISTDIRNHIENFSKKIYRSIDCKGIIRIDYILDSDRTKIYINEVNTIPGSLSYYLWEPKGVKFSELLDIIIEEAIKYNIEQKSNITRYDSNVLEKLNGTKSIRK